MSNAYLYLNQLNTWSGAPHYFQGVVNHADGTLSLATVPQSESVVMTIANALSGPAGIGVDSQGNVYIADPDGNRILIWNDCGETCILDCISHEGSLPGQLKTPRGVLVGDRGQLYIADSGNHRIQVIDLVTLQVLAIWGQPDAYDEPTSSDVPGHFNDPWDLASDSGHFIYVVDHGNRRVQKFSPDGNVVPEFWQRMAATQPHGVDQPTPAYIATIVLDGAERLLVLDQQLGQQKGRLYVFDTDGQYDEAATERWMEVTVDTPGGIAFDGTTIYVGSQGLKRVLCFDIHGKFLGEAQDYHGPVAGLTLDAHGRLFVHPGGGSITALNTNQAYVEAGSLWAGPINRDTTWAQWMRLTASGDLDGEDTHLQVFTLTTDTVVAYGSLPPLPSHEADSADLTPLDVWRPAPIDSLDLLILNEPGAYLWIAVRLQGDGHHSPHLDQILIDFAPDNWLRYLPAIYNENSAFLGPFLALFESLLNDEVRLIDDMPRLFGVDTVPDGTNSQSWLTWLASWLDFDLASGWTEAKQRSFLSQAFALYARRGTRDALQRLVAWYTGVDARIYEAEAYETWWSLGDGAIGDAGLLAFSPEGSVLGTSAVLNESKLLRDEDTPLIEPLAPWFVVEVYEAELVDSTAADSIIAVLDREKPAHTMYRLNVIGPRMSVGRQARLGIDTIVAGNPPDFVLDENNTLDRVLGALPQGSRLDKNARLGRQSVLNGDETYE